MGYNTESTEWPTAAEVPQAIRDLIDRFYSLLDDDRPEVGATLADEVFTPDGVAYFGGAAFHGISGYVVLVSEQYHVGIGQAPR